MPSYRRSYSELLAMPTFLERFEYLSLPGMIGRETFGSQRYLNQEFYRSREWKRLRDNIIVRDNGCDLGVEGFDIFDKIIVHHINPLTIADIEDDVDEIYDPEFLICCSFDTHNAIHYGDERLLPSLPVERRPGDTCPWK